MPLHARSTKSSVFIVTSARRVPLLATRCPLPHLSGRGHLLLASDDERARWLESMLIACRDKINNSRAIPQCSPIISEAFPVRVQPINVGQRRARAINHLYRDVLIAANSRERRIRISRAGLRIGDRSVVVVSSESIPFGQPGRSLIHSTDCFPAPKLESR